MSVVTDTGSLIPTLDASNLTYQFEKIRVKRPEINNVELLLENVNKTKKIPNNLEYLDDFHHSATGTSGTAFRDKNTGQIIVAYTGTNPEADLIKDGITDVVDVALGVGGHYFPAYDFYEKISLKYGTNNVILTGHSLGGNIAQRVSLKYNVQNTVIYNSAPLYVPAIAERPFSRSSGFVGRREKTPANEMVEGIKRDMAHFTGKVTRIRTTQDWLNKLANSVNAVYIGEEYTLFNSGGHGLDDIVNNDEQVAQLYTILQGKNSYLNVSEEIIPLDSHLRNVDIDGDGTIDVHLGRFDARPKNLLAKDDSLIVSHQKIKIDVNVLLVLSSNLRQRIYSDIAEMKKITQLCIQKNATVVEDFTSRKEKITESIKDVFKQAGVVHLMNDLYDSVGTIVTNRSLIEEATHSARLHSTYFTSSQEPMVNGGRLQFSFYNQQLYQLQQSAQQLLDRINREKTGGALSFIFGYKPTILKSWEVIENQTIQLLKSSDAIFEGDGLREGKKDGISESLKIVLKIILENTIEIEQTIVNVANFIGALSGNFDQLDSWLGKQLTDGNFSGTFRGGDIPIDYKAYLERDAIFDDVKGVLQAFDRQVEQRSREYAKKVATIYQETLGHFESGLQDWLSCGEVFKPTLTTVMDNYDTDVYIKQREVVYEYEDNDFVEKVSDSVVYWGKLEALYPAHTKEIIQQLKNTIVPTFDKIQHALWRSQNTKNQLSHLENKLKPIIEDGVYHAFDLDEIVKGQKAVASIADRLGKEINHVIEVIEINAMQAQAIGTLKEKLSQTHQLIAFYTQFVNDCFGDNENNSYVIPSGGGNKYATFTLN